MGPQVAAANAAIKLRLHRNAEKTNSRFTKKWPASPVWLAPGARSRARGSRGLCFLHAALERAPLVELTGVARTPLRRARHTGQIVPPSTRQARCRAAEALKALKCSARLDRRASRCPFGPLRVTPAAVPPSFGALEGSDAAAVAPGKLSHPPQGFEPCGDGSACASRPTALPPASPRRWARGTCGGIFKAVGRETCSLLRLL